jgi:Fe-S oxidoreductase
VLLASFLRMGTCYWLFQRICESVLKRIAAEHPSSQENQAKFDKLTILDSIEFVHGRVLPRLVCFSKVQSVALHPVCSAIKMGITPELIRIAEACSKTVLVPRDAGCCAFAGDRGFLFPELTASATNIEAAQAIAEDHDEYFSSSPDMRLRPGRFIDLI